MKSEVATRKPVTTWQKRHKRNEIEIQIKRISTYAKRGGNTQASYYLTKEIQEKYDIKVLLDLGLVFHCTKESCCVLLPGTWRPHEFPRAGLSLAASERQIYSLAASKTQIYSLAASVQMIYIH